MLCAVDEPFAYTGADRCNGARAVIKMASVVAELVFSKVAVQMLLADAVIDTIQPTFHDTEKSLDRVAVNVADDVLFDAVLRVRVAALEVVADARVGAVFVGQNASRLMDVISDQALQRVARDVRHWPRFDATATLNKATTHCLFVPRPGLLTPG